MSKEQTTDPVAIKWLLYRHGMTVEQAKEAMTGLCAEGSGMQKLRREAQIVADFVEVLNV